MYTLLQRVIIACHSLHQQFSQEVVYGSAPTQVYIIQSFGSVLSLYAQSFMFFMYV